ncbi:MAG TPA: hypothetical protein VK517_07510 [Cyclobacteriaceae bacterium]|nr:hypothetical protein [Cyclobacteriaceae bacterium]
MATGTKRKAKANAIVSDKVKDYGNDPYFVKKAKESKAFLEKHGFPKQLALGAKRKANV